MTGGQATSVLARHDDDGTSVSIFVGGVRTDHYYVHAADGDWRTGVPDGARVNEVPAR